jgi:hypothetical protein
MIESIDEKINQLNRIAPLLSELSESGGALGLLESEVIRVSGTPTKGLHQEDISKRKDSNSLATTSVMESAANESISPKATLKTHLPREVKNATNDGVSDFFLRVTAKIPGPRCNSLALSAELRSAAIKKNGKSRDMRDENLLFSPSIIQKTLTLDKVRNILRCGCKLCGSVKGGDLLTDNILTDAILTQDGDELRRLFALLTFMGAGFAVRHICSFSTRGWDITTRESSIRSLLFEPMEQSTKGIFPTPAAITLIFTDIFKKTWPLFATPVMQIEKHMIRLTGESLPFLNERPLNADKSSFGSMYSFEIHPEFCGENIPVSCSSCRSLSSYY